MRVSKGDDEAASARRPKRRDAGSTRFSERDRRLLGLIGEQYAISLEQLARLIDRHILTAVCLRNRWLKAGWVEGRGLATEGPSMIWLTSEGVRAADSPYRRWRPQPALAAHIHAVTEVRLLLERQLCTRRVALRARARPDAPPRVRLGGRISPTGVLDTGGEQIAIEVELSAKSRDRLNEILDRARAAATTRSGTSPRPRSSAPSRRSPQRSPGRTSTSTPTRRARATCSRESRPAAARGRARRARARAARSGGGRARPASPSQPASLLAAAAGPGRRLLLWLAALPSALGGLLLWRFTHRHLDARPARAARPAARQPRPGAARVWPQLWPAWLATVDARAADRARALAAPAAAALPARDARAQRPATPPPRAADRRQGRRSPARTAPGAADALFLGYRLARRRAPPLPPRPRLPAARAALPPPARRRRDRLGEDRDRAPDRRLARAHERLDDRLHRRQGRPARRRRASRALMARRRPPRLALPRRALRRLARQRRGDRRAAARSSSISPTRAAAPTTATSPSTRSGSPASTPAGPPRGSRELLAPPPPRALARAPPAGLGRRGRDRGAPARAARRDPRPLRRLLRDRRRRARRRSRLRRARHRLLPARRAAAQARGRLPRPLPRRGVHPVGGRPQAPLRSGCC